VIGFVAVDEVEMHEDARKDVVEDDLDDEGDEYLVMEGGIRRSAFNYLSRTNDAGTYPLTSNICISLDLV
jgi:hypothetical protein